MSKLDNLAKGARGKKGDIADAVDSTEKIRQWVSTSLVQQQQSWLLGSS